MVLDPIAQLDPAAIAAVIALFLATYFALRRFVLLPLIRLMEARAQRISQALASRQSAEAALRDAQLRADRILAEARAEAERIAEAAKEERRQARESALARAREESEAIRARGREEAEELRRSKEAELAEHLDACAGEALRALVGDVDQAALKFLVARTLAEEEAR